MLALLVAACGSAAISGIDGSRGADTFGLINVTPGEAGDFTGWLVNHSSRTVVLRGAALLRLSGYRLPRLAGVAIEPGRNFIGAGRKWPTSQVGVRPFAGFKLHSGQTAQILIGMDSGDVGDYAARGIAVTISAANQTTTVPSISPSAICVVSSPRTECSRAFTTRFADMVSTTH